MSLYDYDRILEATRRTLQDGRIAGVIPLTFGRSRIIIELCRGGIGDSW